VWEVPSGKTLRTLPNHDGPVTAVAVAADGKVATGSADKKVRIWPAASEPPTHTLGGHTAAITAVAWSRDHKTLATAADESDVILWSADTGKQLRKLERRNGVQSLAFSPDGLKLAVGGADDRVHIFQVNTGKQLHEFEKPGSPPQTAALAWSFDGKSVLAGRGNHTLQYWSLTTNKEVQNLPTMAPVNCVAVSADNKTLVGGSLDRAVRFWDIGTGKLKLTLIADASQILSVGADGNYRCPDEAASELVAVVQTDAGQETLSLKEFARRFGFRNAPGTAK
jgi:WD40 repeat protein